MLVGHSYGGLIAAAAAARMPERVRALVVLDGFLPRDSASIFDMHPEVRELMAPAMSDNPLPPSSRRRPP